jgi:pimeloyl-ACP methyl ester carboxylesterase
MAFSEQPAFFPAGGFNLAGILTLPEAPSQWAVILPWGAGAFPSSARNRIRTRLARALAADGLPAFRFDYSGVGESGGSYRIPTMASPYVEEVVAGCNFLRTQGFQHIIVVANCFGAWSALLAAPSIEGLAGMVLVNCPIRRDHDEVRAANRSWQWWWRHLKRFQWSKLFNSRRRALYRRLVKSRAKSLVGAGVRDGRFTTAVKAVLGRGVPVQLMYGNDGFRPDFETELSRGLTAHLRPDHRPSGYITVDERVEGFASLASQQLLIEKVRGWVAEFVRPPYQEVPEAS